MRRRRPQPRKCSPLFGLHAQALPRLRLGRGGIRFSPVRNHTGVAARAFSALTKEGINILMISTSEIKITILIDEKYLELAVRILHDTFGLDWDIN